MIASNRDRRAMLRTRRQDNKRRALTTHLVHMGVPLETLPAITQGLRNAAKRLGVRPVARKRTSRQMGVQGRVPSRTVYRWTRIQLRVLVPAYKPRKPEYKAAVSRLSSALAA